MYVSYKFWAIFKFPHARVYACVLICVCYIIYLFAASRSVVFKFSRNADIFFSSSLASFSICFTRLLSASTSLLIFPVDVAVMTSSLRLDDLGVVGDDVEESVGSEGEGVVNGCAEGELGVFPLRLMSNLITFATYDESAVARGGNNTGPNTEAIMGRVILFSLAYVLNLWRKEKRCSHST